MAVVFALQAYYRAVRDDLAVRDPLVQHFFGWRKVPRQNTTANAVIIWVPGNESGDCGEDLPSLGIGANPRQIASLDEYATVRIRAHDPAGPEEDELQYAIVRLLYDEWRASICRAAYGIVHLSNPKWNITKGERRLGAELIIPCRFRAPIPDFDPAVDVNVTAILNASLAERFPEDATTDSGAPADTDAGDDTQDDMQGTTVSIPIDPSEGA